jgi:hypothetical protein
MSAQGWLFSIRTWEAPYNADGSRGIMWSATSGSDPAKIAEDIAGACVFQSDTLLCLTDLAAGKRYEVLVKVVRTVSYVAQAPAEKKS